MMGRSQLSSATAVLKTIHHSNNIWSTEDMWSENDRCWIGMVAEQIVHDNRRAIVELYGSIVGLEVDGPHKVASECKYNVDVSNKVDGE